MPKDPKDPETVLRDHLELKRNALKNPEVLLAYLEELDKDIEESNSVLDYFENVLPTHDMVKLLVGEIVDLRKRVKELENPHWTKGTGL